ncbi:hypothetical protein QFZ68_000759 [Streptomyces sp. V1I6]|nr:hypothetical protein [Streptomyces sp. V1I6]
MPRDAQGEGAGEADPARHSGERRLRPAQQFGGKGDPPFAQVAHRRLPDQSGEAPGQCRPGDACLGRQGLDRPWVGRVGLQQP